MGELELPTRNSGVLSYTRGKRKRKWIRRLETQEAAHTLGTYMNPSDWQSVPEDIFVGLPGTVPLEDS